MEVLNGLYISGSKQCQFPSFFFNLFFYPGENYILKIVLMEEKKSQKGYITTWSPVERQSGVRNFLSFVFFLSFSCWLPEWKQAISFQGEEDGVKGEEKRKKQEKERKE